MFDGKYVMIRDMQCHKRNKREIRKKSSP